MILLVDAGNTRIKWRLIPVNKFDIIDENAYTYDHPEKLFSVFAQYPQVKRLICTNVAGTRAVEHITVSAKLSNLSPEWITAQKNQSFIKSLYNLENLGADRWAALIGARSLHPHASLVVSAGTATTIDLLDDSGTFLGGLILPGVELMQYALFTNTAQLPLLQGTFNIQPRNTADSIYSGCLQAQAGAIERMFRQIQNTTHPLCLVSGGAAHLFSNLLDIPIKHVNNLVLDGLAIIANDSTAASLSMTISL